MKYSIADYVTAGYNYEKALNSTAQAERIRKMLESENIEERSEARRLIEQGRAEARSKY
jgi:phosphosulfolactate phosphohydrolase-like enzyme